MFKLIYRRRQLIHYSNPECGSDNPQNFDPEDVIIAAGLIYLEHVKEAIESHESLPSATKLPSVSSVNLDEDIISIGFSKPIFEGWSSGTPKDYRAGDADYEDRSNDNFFIREWGDFILKFDSSAEASLFFKGRDIKSYFLSGF